MCSEMKLIAVIPARFSSTRLPGKPLADICGKPMLWWVYAKLSSMDVFSQVICAVDDERIATVCQEYKMKYMMTSNDHSEHISRIHEVSEYVKAEYYICINGDEPLISEQCILPALPKELHKEPYFSGVMRVLKSPAETIDFSNIKVVTNRQGRCIYMSRSPVPYPRGTYFFDYKKYVGVECFNKSALDFFVSTPMGEIERVEDIDHLRFLENGVDMYFHEVESESISVDTQKDLEYVRKIMMSREMACCAGGDSQLSRYNANA